MNLVNEQHRVGLVFEVLQHAFQALLKVAAVFGTGQQRAHVERVNNGVGQHFGHVVLCDAPSQALGDGGFSHTGLANQQWIIFSAAAQNLDHALNFVFAPNQRINFAVACQLVQVLGELLNR